jgi:hypothetical protein
MSGTSQGDASARSGSPTDEVDSTESAAALGHVAVLREVTERFAATPSTTPLDDRLAPAEREALRTTVVLRAVDADRVWARGPGWTLEQGTPSSWDAEIIGAACALALFVWRRPVEPAAIEVDGDADVIKVFRTARVVP